MEANDTQQNQQDLSEIIDWINKLQNKSQEVMSALVQINQQYWQENPTDYQHMLETLTRFMQSIYAHPNELIQIQTQYWQSCMDLWQQSFQLWLGKDIQNKQPAPSHRFKNEHWQSNPMFHTMKQFYLLTAKMIATLIASCKDLDEKTKQQLSFYSQQIIDALSPENFLVTNPEVLTKTLQTKGKNLLQGMDNLLKDIRNNRFNITITDKSAFTVGKNIAATPGKVIFKNELIELIQYQASEKQVYAVPILLIPPFINKYYILDLSPDNSLVKWLVEQGHTVYIISWVNSDKKYANYAWEDYLTKGSLAAINCILKRHHCPHINALGFCVGGTLLATTAAYLAETNQLSKLQSVTFLTTLLDFTHPGNLGIFVTDTQVNHLENLTKKYGYIDGYRLALAFNMLKANDLIWSNYVNNYLSAKTPKAFDLLYWNADPSNLPAKMYIQYLRWMYLENKLITPGAISLLGKPLDLGKINIPSYFLAAKKDHIVPWQSCFDGTQYLNGKKTFVLTGSGHIAGVVNPPQNKKYSYQVVENPCNKLCFQQESPETIKGSWWPHWQHWLTTLSDKKIQAMPIQGGIVDAPGTYVLKQSSDILRCDLQNEFCV